MVSWQWEPGGEASGGIRGSEKAGMQHAGSQPAHPRPQRGAASADAAVGYPDPVLRPVPCSYLIRTILPGQVPETPYNLPSVRVSMWQGRSCLPQVQLYYPSIPLGKRKEQMACWDWGSRELLGKLTWHGGQNDRVEIRSASEGGEKSLRDGREGPKRASTATQRTG